MEKPATIYCDVLDPIEDIQSPPPPLPKRNENISVSSSEGLNSFKRTPPLRSMNYITTSCQRCRENSSSKTQAVLSIAVASFAILSAVFMTLYFTTEAKCRSNDCKNSFRNTSHKDFCACQNCSIVSNFSSLKNTSNNKGKYKRLYHAFFHSLLRLYVCIL